MIALVRIAFDVLLVALAAGVPAAAQDELRPALGTFEDVTDQGLAFVELALEREATLLHEPVVVRLRFGLEAGFLRTSLVQLFQRELDVPVQVQAAWLDALDGAVLVESGEPEQGASIALGERIVRAMPLADAEIGGKTYRVFELVRTLAPTRAGALELAAPLLRFAFATRFEDDFVQGRRALDRRDALVRGSAARLTVRPLPEEGRPAEFSGAIGRFTVEATAEPARLVLGESFALVLRVVARSPVADLTHAAEPRLDGLAGFHLRGSLVERAPDRLTVRYDLVPRAAGVMEVPPIRFAYFDTTPPAGYVTVETRPVPLVVEAPPAPEAAPRAEAQEPEPVPASPGGTRTLLVAALAVALLALGAFVVRRVARRP